jgi:hypothetical protein
LENQFVAPLPEFKMLKLDHRGGRETVRYYQSRSAINQLDDGSVVIEDGYGSQLVMSGGNVTVNAPGDVWMRPGRSFVAWAPFDAILRGGNCAEISASKKDVRIKAEKNLHLLAGNSGQDGALLLESRSQGLNNAADWAETGERANTHGVIVLCPKSSFHAMAGDVYIGCDKNSERQVVCIDGTDEGKLYLRGAEVVASIKDLFGVLSTQGKRLLALSQDATIVSTPNNLFGGTIIVAPVNGSADIICGGNLIVHESALFNNSVITNGGYAAVQGAPFVGKTKRVDPGPDPSTYVAQIKSGIDEVQKIVDDLDETEIKSAETGPGNSGFREKNGFSCRDSEKDLQLDSGSFVLHEARWQMLMRLGKAGSGKTWEEPVVKAPNGEETMPHPGKQAWQDWSSAFGQAGAPVNFDYGAGRANSRESMSETAPSENKTSLSGGYKVVKRSE